MPNIVSNIFPTGSIPELTIGCFKDGAQGASAKAALAGMTQDVCTSFINNQITTLTRSKTFNTMQNLTQSVMQRSNQMISLVANYIDPAEISRILQDIVSNVCTSLLSYMQSTVTTSVQRIISFPELSYMTSQSTTRFKEKIKDDIADIMNQLSTIGQDMDEAAMMTANKEYSIKIEDTKKKFAKFIDNVKNKCAEINDYVNETIIPVMEEYTDKAVYYLTDGPDILLDMINKRLHPILGKACKFIEGLTDDIERIKAIIINWIIDAMVAIMYFFFKLLIDWVKKINQRIIDAINAKLEKLKQDAKEAAAKAIGDATGNQELADKSTQVMFNTEQIKKSVKKAQMIIDVTKMLIQFVGAK